MRPVHPSKRRMGADRGINFANILRPGFVVAAGLLKRIMAAP